MFESCLDATGILIIATHYTTAAIPLPFEIFYIHLQRYTQSHRLLTALFTKPPASRFPAVLNQNMRLRMCVHAKRTGPVDAKSQCRRHHSHSCSFARKKAIVQNDLRRLFCMAVFCRSLFLLDRFRT